MKKNYLFGMALMASLAFFSCTNEVIYVHDGESSEQVSDEQIITLQVSNGGDGLTTRAGRPLYSSEAKQTIDKVYVYFCTGDNVVKIHKIENWSSSSTEYTNNGHGREAVLKFTGNDKLTAASYTVYAIGYHSGSEYESLTTTLSGITTSSKEDDIKDLVLTYGVADNAEEIFAGSLTIDLSSATSTGFKKTIVLNRQVAGAFVYVEEIPFVSASHQYLKLIASAKNSKIVLGNFANKEYTSNGANTSTNVVNGTETTVGDVVISCIDLTQWFTNIDDGDNDGLIDTGDSYNNWKNPLRQAETTPTFKKGSVFGGTFLIPFAKQDSKQTLKLVLSTSEAATSVAGDREWNINLPTDDNQVQTSFALTTPLVADGSVTWSAGSATAETANIYSILRNHLYGVGKRTIDNPGESGEEEPDPSDPDPENPDPGIDDPESLNNKQELTLRVNDNWEIIHEMVID